MPSRFGSPKMPMTRVCLNISTPWTSQSEPQTIPQTIRHGWKSTWKTSRWYLLDISLTHCLAKGVRFCCTTRIALCTFSAFIRSAYVLIVFTPTFASSGKKTKIWMTQTLCYQHSIWSLICGFGTSIMSQLSCCCKGWVVPIFF
jgi:hypothetical protein